LLFDLPSYLALYYIRFTGSEETNDFQLATFSLLDFF